MPYIPNEQAQENRKRLVDAIMRAPKATRGSWGYAPEVDDAIARAATESGIDPEWLRAYAMIESSGNPRAKTGSYKGLFQLHDREGRGDLFDPANNAKYAGQNFVNLKRMFVKRYGREPTMNELYMMHQQGPGGAFAHLDNPQRKAWESMYSTREGRNKGEKWAQKAIWGNVPSDRRRQFGNVDNITSQQFVDMWNDKMNSRIASAQRGEYANRRVRHPQLASQQSLQPSLTMQPTPLVQPIQPQAQPFMSVANQQDPDEITRQLNLQSLRLAQARNNPNQMFAGNFARVLPTFFQRGNAGGGYG